MAGTVNINNIFGLQLAAGGRGEWPARSQCRRTFSFNHFLHTHKRKMKINHLTMTIVKVTV